MQLPTLGMICGGKSSEASQGLGEDLADLLNQLSPSLFRFTPCSRFLPGFYRSSKANYICVIFIFCFPTEGEDHSGPIARTEPGAQ